MATVKGDPPSPETLKAMKEFFIECKIRRLREAAKKERELQGEKYNVKDSSR